MTRSHEAESPPQIVGASTRRIVSRRSLARRFWRIVQIGHADERAPKSMPGYFADRYAHALASPPSEVEWRSLSKRARWRLETDFEQMVGSRARPTAHLQGWVPNPVCPTEVGDLYQDLRRRWAAHCYANGLPASVAELLNAASMTWSDVFAASVFFPQPPVFLGVNYWDKLSEEARSVVVDTFGPSAPIDFFCFILQVHETVHGAQTGEPLLNEIVQAALWMDFLDANELWVFQVAANGDPLVREHEIVRSHPEIASRARAAAFDTAVMIDRLAPTDAYALCCATANQFNRGTLRYSEYLTRISEILGRADDSEWLDSQLKGGDAASRLRLNRMFQTA
ncbi:MAG TPA: hypothetical protein PKE05_02585 [Microthrixaceae bacterium]|nr:hypothetical protein [Microthrixaceae bacterium]